MRIWVARPHPGASRTAARLNAIGHDPLVAPILTITETGEPPPQRRFDAVLLASANAVPAVARAGLPDMPVLAVGARTAERARAAGLSPVTGADGDAAALVELVAAQFRPGSALLLAAGSDRKAEPVRSLREGGFDVAVWTVYAAVPVPELPGSVEKALRGGGAERLSAVLHYSRRSATIALVLAHSAGCAQRLTALDHFCLSADVAVPLVEAGIVSHFVAAHPDEDSLLGLLSCAHRGADTH